MKVSNIPYKRITIEEFESKANELILRAERAENGEELAAVREQWLELVKELTTAQSVSYMRFTLNTRDEFYLKEKDYYDEVVPVEGNIANRFEKAVLNNPHRTEAGRILPLVFKKYEVDLKASDERIVEDMQEENRCVTEYAKLMAEMTFDFRGEKLPLPLLKKYMSGSSRETRREAYEVLGRTLEQSRAALDGIFDRLVHIRTRMARKLGYENFVQLGYYRMGRLCYDEEMVKSFRSNVLRDVVPVVSGLRKELAGRLGIAQMKLYDNDTFFLEGNPKPVLSVEEIFENGKKMYEEMSPKTGEFIRMMIENDAFDVLSREGKWGGGYCTSFPKYRQPFILANFNGTSADIDVLTHEAGHAFADFMTADNDADLGVGGMETAETHSMSMEFFCWKWMDRFFGARANDYRYMHLLDSLSFLPYGTIVDYFQHIVYENPDMTPAERNAAWRKLEGKFRPYMDAEGIPYLEEGTRWQYQMHIFETPFYYIDYCLAQSVALQFLLLSQKDYADAFSRYYRLLSRGGEKVFTELVEEAGLKSPFAPGALSAVSAEAKQLLLSLQK